MRKFFLTRVIATDSDESGSQSEEESEEGSDEEMQVGLARLLAQSFTTKGCRSLLQSRPNVEVNESSDLHLQLFVS